MLKMKYLVMMGVVVAGIAVAPLVISNSLDTKLEDNKVMLQKNGFKQEILSKSGYITNTRNFSLEVVDATKARDFLLDKLVEKNAQYKVFAQSLKMASQGEINEAFNGLTFKGEMVNSNFSPSNIKMSLVLDKLPLTIQNELVKNKEIGDALLPLIAKGILALDMTFGSGEFVGDMKLKDLKLRDIKEQIKIEGAVLNIDTLNHMLSLSESGGVVNGVFGVAKQDFGLKAPMSEMKSHLENLKYNFSYKDDLNNKGTFEVGKYEFEMVEIYSNVKFSASNIKATSTVEDINKELHLKGDYVINTVMFMNETDEMKVNKVLFKIFLRGINSDTMKKLQSDYNALALGVGAPDDKAIIDDFVAFINNGMKLDLGIALNGLSGTFNLKDVAVDVTLEVAKNNYTDKQSPLDILNFLDISSHVKIHKDDKKTLEELNIATPEDFANGKVEGDFFVYDIAMKNGAITVNGKPIQ